MNRRITTFEEFFTLAKEFSEKGGYLDTIIALRPGIHSSHQFAMSPDGKKIIDYSNVDGSDTAYNLNSFRNSFAAKALGKGRLFQELPLTEQEVRVREELEKKHGEQFANSILRGGE